MNVKDFSVCCFPCGQNTCRLQQIQGLQYKTETIETQFRCISVIIVRQNDKTQSLSQRTFAPKSFNFSGCVPFPSQHKQAKTWFLFLISIILRLHGKPYIKTKLRAHRILFFGAESHFRHQPSTNKKSDNVHTPLVERCTAE